jgi:hypothetical protein
MPHAPVKSWTEATACSPAVSVGVIAGRAIPCLVTVSITRRLNMTNMALKLIQAKYERSEPVQCRLVIPGAVVALVIKRAGERRNG